jgi:hypothetical protein
VKVQPCTHVQSEHGYLTLNFDFMTVVRQQFHSGQSCERMNVHRLSTERPLPTSVCVKSVNTQDHDFHSLPDVSSLRAQTVYEVDKVFMVYSTSWVGK